MADEKMFVFPESQSGSLDASSIMAMLNNNGGLGGGNWIWFFFLILLFGRNGFGNCGMDSHTGTDLLMQAINGNKDAVGNLATNLNCDINAINSAINSLQMSGQLGRQALSSQLSQCCCDNKTTAMQSGYESQIATLNQTNALGSKIDGNTAAITSAIASQTNLITDQFCQLKEREMQSKIDSLIADKASLQAHISNANQTAAFAQMLAPIQSEVASIRSGMPPTVAVPYPQLSAIPTSYLYGNYGTNVFANSPQWA